MTVVVAGPTQPSVEGRAPRERCFVLVWAAVVAVGLGWGRLVDGSDVGLGATPFAGRWGVRLHPAVLVVCVVGVGIVAGGPSAARRLRWPAVPVAAGIAAMAWALVLAAIHGWDQVTAPLTTRYEYEPFAASIDSARAFVSHFVESVPDLPTHVKAHPPGATLVPWALDRVGLGGAGWFAALTIAAWGVAVGSALVATRAVVGEGAARRAAPALVLLPAVLWVATSADALFAGASAAGVAIAVARPGNRRWAIAGGGVLGAALLLSYGAVLVLVIPIAVAVRRRRYDDLAWIAVGVTSVVLVAAAVGFWWPAGAAAAREAYWNGVASRRSLAYLTVAGNLAALALALGPAVAAGLRRSTHVLVAGGLVAVVLADVSLLSAGEVERIWLPFVPWIALAAPGMDRLWLGVQAACGLALAVVLRSPW